MATTTTEPQKVRTPISTSARGMNLFDALENYKGLRTPNNLDVDAHLKDGGRLPGSWVLGTGGIYEAPGKKFGGEVRSEGLVYQVPQKYQGLKDAVLIFQSGFSIDRKTGLYAGEITHLVEEYPAPDGWYAVHKETGIPQGKKISDSDPNARYSYRNNDGNYIGAVVRGYDDFVIYFRRDVDLCRWPGDDRFRVALFSQAEPEQVKQALAQSSFISTLRNDAKSAEPILEKLRPIMRTEDFDKLKRVISGAKTLEIKE